MRKNFIPYLKQNKNQKLTKNPKKTPLVQNSSLTNLRSIKELLYIDCPFYLIFQMLTVKCWSLFNSGHLALELEVPIYFSCRITS